MGKLFDKLTEDYFYVPHFYTDSDFGDSIKLRFDFVDEKIFIDGKEVEITLQIKN